VTDSALSLETRWLTAADGVRLFVRQYRPANFDGRRTVLWCHGIGEHGGRQEHVIREFQSRGWQVIIPDLRGHGRSEGIRADVAKFETYLSDFDQIVQEFDLHPRRTALFGHSFGGLIMTRWMQTRSHSWAALAMSAPLFGIAKPIATWKWWLGHLLAYIAPRTHLPTGLREDNMSADPEFQAKRRADPLIQHAVTVRWFFAMQAALKLAHRDAGKRTLPILILQGTADQTTDPRMPEEWLRTTGSADTRLITYFDGLHEMLNDRDWRTACADLLRWLEERVPSAAQP
jgi:lysophospholipase